MENYKKLKELILSLEPDVEKIEKKSQSQAAIRVRAKLQEIRLIAKDLREDIQETLRQAEIKKLEGQ